MTTWVTYKNGNYSVDFNLNTGTKIRHNNLDFFAPEKPESIDMKITNCCYGVNGVPCPMCHENSSPDGTYGDVLNIPFLDTLLPYTEIAIGGGDPILHPYLVNLLEMLKERKLIANITVNQWTFMNQYDYIKSLVDNGLIYGLGVSLNDPTDEFIDAISEFPNAVIHVINGLITMDKLKYMAHRGLKILILGYKTFGRGKGLYSHKNDEIEQLKSSFYDSLPTIIEDELFDVVSFDNLAIEQLNPKRLMGDDEWSRFYMGNDGQFSLYVDLVEKKFAKSSTSDTRYNLMDNIVDMFNVVRNE